MEEVAAVTMPFLGFFMALFGWLWSALLAAGCLGTELWAGLRASAQQQGREVAGGFPASLSSPDHASDVQPLFI